MLSNPPPSGLPARHHRQHRRQNSTPTAMEAVKIANNLPPYPHQQQHGSSAQPQPPQPQQARAGRPRVAHRRGMSLDTRRQHMHSPVVRQDFLTVSEQQNTNIAGYSSAPQHVLREAQQQRLARPGSHQQAFANLANDENYIMSPHGTPHTQAFAPNTCFDGLPGSAPALNMSYNLYSEQMNAMVKKNQENFNGNMAAGSQDFELYPPSTMSTPTFMHFNESPSGNAGWISEEETSSSRRSSRRVSNTLMDRVAKFENMGLEDPPRPITPPHQNATDYFPITPMDSPHGRTTIKSSRGPQRFMEGYDESMEETLKPTRGPRRIKTTFDEMREAAETQSPAPVPGPSRSNTMPVTSSFEAPPVANNFLEMSQMSGGMAVPTFDGLPEAPYPLSAHSSFSHHSTPITPLMHEFRQGSEQKPYLLPPETAVESVSGEESESGERPPRGSSHRRTESVASVASAASIADIDIEQTKTTTGITMDDIHQYIDGPDPQDNKWVCTFEDCLKRFGRKENIKSHVQTHLNDRQYQCPTCQKCFVRQHDLKRHAKIHTGIKPYPCECGNSFARHDALTRHKQRGMCIGAFDGVVRKVVKRGRPRKHRPELDERQEKSTRTRKKNMSISSTSSQSGYSDSSAPNSPGIDDNDNDNDTDFELLGDIMHDVSMGGTTMNPSNLQPSLGASTAPMPTLSPHAALGERSPSVTSIHSYVSQLSHMSLHPAAAAEGLPSNPASPAKSVGSQYNEPPELSQSSSPPASCNRYFELEPSVTGPDIMISAAVDPTSLPPMGGMGNGGGEDDVLLQFTHNDPNMLMLSSDSKFDEAFDSSVDMFTHSDDLFFGHNQ